MKIKILIVVLLCSFFSWGQATLPLTRTAWGTTPTGWTDIGINRTTNYACSGNDGGSMQATGKSYKVWFSGTANKLTYSVKGSNPTNGDFRVQESVDGLTWTDVVTYATISGSTCISEIKPLLSTTRYVQFIYITKTLGNVDIDDVNISFTAGCLTPTSQASAVAPTNITNVGVDFSWLNGATATGTMLVITSGATTAPTGGTSYVPNTAWASAGQIDTNNRVVYRGTGTSVTGITGLTPGTLYTATVYSYNDPGSCYNLTSPISTTFYTLATEPSGFASSFTCNAISSSQINLSFSAANTITNADGYMILYRAGAAPTGVPMDGASYPAGTVFGDATVAGQTSITGTDTTFNVTGLSGGTTYYFSLVPFNSNLSTAPTLNYKTTGGIPITNCTTLIAIPVVTGASLTGSTGTAFSYNIIATSSPTSYALASGTLPTGLTLNTTTGVISGTPTAIGSFSITVTATNSAGTSSPAATISFVISAGISPCVTQGFGGGTVAPSGWIFTGISSIYTTAGNYGLASPSLSFDTTNDAITTEVLATGNAASQLSFWIKGQGILTGSTSTLQVDGYDGSTWTNIETISSATLIASSSAAITKTYNSGSTPALSPGFVRFRFTYLKGGGNLAIDDVAINCTAATVNAPVVIGSSEIGTVGSVYSYTVNASNYPTSYAIVAGSLPPGLTFNTTTGQISGAPTTLGSYSIDVTATNSGGTSASATISYTINAYVAGCYTENFNDGIAKLSYVGDNVTLNGLIWNLSEALIGTTNTANDYGLGNYCIRMRSNNYAASTMYQDKANGIGTISFDYKEYITTPILLYTNQLFNVEYSKDSGNTWIYIGSVAPSSTTSTTFNATVNQSGPIRVRFIFASGTENNMVRLNIDNLSICDYVSATKDIEVFGNSTTILNNSVTVSINNNTYFSPTYFVGDAPIVKTFVIKNNGTGTLNLSSLAISSSPYFSITSGLSSTSLAIGQSATFSVTFSSTVTGLENANITILSDDPIDGTYTFLISTKVYNYVRCTLMPLAYIAQQDFDSNVGYTYTAGATNANTSVAGNTNYGNSRSIKSNMFMGSNSFQSFNNTNTITFASLNTQTYQNIEMDFNLGGYSSATNGGLDTPDYVLISTSIDGGNTYYNQLEVTGNNDSIFDINNTLPTNTSVYKVNSTNPSRFGTLNNSTNTLASSFKITNLPSVADLIIKITFVSSNANEIWAIDNIAVKGQLPLTTTWDGSQWLAGAPTSSTKAIFNGSYDTTTNGASVQTCECQLNASNAVSVTSGNYLEVQSNLTNNGTINIADSGSLVQVNDDGINSGTGITNITRTTTPYEKYDYTYWSSPVTNSTIGAPFSLWRTDYAFYFETANFADLNNDGFDDNQDDWQHVSASTVMQPGKGYAIMAPTTGTFPTTTSVLFSGAVNNGVISIPMALSQNMADPNDDFNLIGNPYPSAIYANDFINANTNFSGTLYFWTHISDISSSNPGPDQYNFISDDYASYNLSGGTKSNTNSSKPSGYVASGQGFFVEAITPTNIVFNNSLRSKAYINTNFYKNAHLNTAVEKNRIWLDIQSSEGLFSQQLIGYFDEATLDFDRGYDGLAYQSSNTVSFYSMINNDKYRIQGRPAFVNSDVVPLGYSSGVSDTYSINIDGQEGIFNDNQTMVYLEDKLLNIIWDLKQAPYSFFTDAGTFNDRFNLRYTNSTLDTNSFQSIDNNVVLSNGNEQIGIKSYTLPIKNVTIYDLLGRKIAEKSNVSSNQVFFNNLTLSRQLLIVKITLENGEIITRQTIL